MIDDDYFDDIFRMMDNIFGRTNIDRRVTDRFGDSNYERLMDDDNIYYTFELRDLTKHDVVVKPTVDNLFITMTRDGKEYTHDLKLPYSIIPKETKVTFINGILDITVKIDKSKSDRIEIEEE